MRQKYRRSVLGPLWLTLSTGVMVAALGVLYAQIFGASLARYVPYLALGLLSWGFISQVLNEGSTVFIQAEGLIRQIRLPLSLHVLRLVARNVIILAHNMLVYVAVVLLLGPAPTAASLMAVPGFLLMLAILTWMATLFGMFGVRYRDIPPLVASMLQLGMFLTPIMWDPASLPRRSAFVTLNPLYYLIEIVRAPLLGETVPPGDWLAAGVLAVGGWLVTYPFFSRFRARIAYWI